jgi:corrinoid protein of di/trimethylamine methyltransferase
MVMMEEISQVLQQGRAKDLKELVQNALNEGVDSGTILDQGLLAGMSVIGVKFKNNEIFVPDVLIAARAMNAGVEVLKPYLVANGVQSIGKVILGTVRGDHHDIGKNLVRVMMEGKGLEVIDLGVDVPAERFIAAVQESGARIIACSALLTTTMMEMEKVVRAIETAGLREQVKIMVGGAPVTESFSRSIGADIYRADATSAAEAAVELYKAS